MRLERVGERERLTIDCGADRVEVGATLSREERGWLYGALREWSERGKGQIVALAWPIPARPPGA